MESSAGPTSASEVTWCTDLCQVNFDARPEKPEGLEGILTYMFDDQHDKVQG